MRAFCKVEINGVPFISSNIVSCNIRTSIIGLPDGELIVKDADSIFDRLIMLPTFSKISID